MVSLILMFSFRAPLLSFLPSRGLLRCWGTLSALCFVPFWQVLVALSVFCLRCSFFLLSRFHGYLARPAFVSPRRRSLFLSPRSPFRSLSWPFFALPHGRLLYCLVFLFGSFFLFCALASVPPGVSSYGFFDGWSSCFLVLCCGCCLFVFLLVFTSCYRFVGLFSSWRDFAGYCRAGAFCHLVILPVLIFTPCWSLLLQLGVCTLQGGGGGGLLALRRLFLRRRIPRVAF